VEQVRRGGSATVYANIHVGVGDRAAAAPQARYDLFSYAVVDAYASSFTRIGYGDAVPVVFPLTWGAAGQGALESTLRAAIASPAPAAHGI
jgi:hypothetical protein